MHLLKVYHPVIFSGFIQQSPLANVRTIPWYPKGDLSPSVVIFHLLLLPAPGNCQSIFYATDLPISDTSYKWNRACSHLWLTSFTQHDSFKVHPTEVFVSTSWLLVADSYFTGISCSIRTRPSFPHSQALPSGGFHKPLTLSLRGQTEWKSQSQKTNETDHMDHSLV